MDAEAFFFGELKRLGVGKRSLNDEFFKDNKIFPALEKRYGVTDIDEEELCHTPMDITCHIPGCLARFSTLMEFESHYNTVHRYLCCVCRKNLPSGHLLDLHFAEKHDSFFAVLSERGPAFACYVQQCPVKCLTPEERKKHCIEVHQFPPDFRFDVQKQKRKSKPQKHKKNNSSDMQTSTEKATEMMLVDENQNTSSSSHLMKNFNFGHSKNRGFSKSAYSGKVFTKDSNSRTTGNEDITEKSALDSEDMFVDLKANLPDC